jgi:hypothetical protein
MDSLFSPAIEWATKRNLPYAIRGDAIDVNCPACETGVLLIHQRNMWWFCWGSGARCWKAGENEKELNALFSCEEAKRAS